MWSGDAPSDQYECLTCDNRRQQEPHQDGNKAMAFPSAVMP